MMGQYKIWLSGYTEKTGKSAALMDIGVITADILFRGIIHTRVLIISKNIATVQTVGNRWREKNDHSRTSRRMAKM